MKPYDPQSQSLQPFLSTIIRRFPSFPIDLRNSESGEESRKSAWRLERGEKQLHSTPRVPIKYTRTLKTWGGEKEPQFGYPTKDHCIGVLQIPAKAQRSLDSGNSPFNREENRIAHKHGYLQWH
ncbi:uncharacterized protein EAE97_006319 [Botrytis byssoidea]|uniref:Uncharacterized protein n=1 Tax=Botrytis byssoidea TaxID=139641 RepID=A0A9P5M6K9_9HELO|nr:uncharacterized protein EAE97_006319 [Botrytis byssoidea]KAF7942865.1 hypothetical protein EAE97_006319 [Botrytis byssoidea]